MTSKTFRSLVNHLQVSIYHLHPLFHWISLGPLPGLDYLGCFTSASVEKMLVYMPHGMYPFMNLYQGDEACVLFVQHTSLRIGEDKATLRRLRDIVHRLWQ